ncbi:GNAT family N-acetyltransferase [Pedobacter endophyticus]|uniref:GNAT family N-acetyltransferase n=1 Tax=Pedobacter endophyticus TaxID=2789740 RepID=A0A7S9L341_9SPHI|nr:GNAT family N-acetyltransferase [Pedobacter endophyticus]QPH41563.1 GNAT family N-acetyltransferase [Pedobacter endophyticus]
MKIRLAATEDIPQIMHLVKKVVPIMRASGNLQWGNDYPNPAVFADDIAKDQLWVATLEGNVVGVSAITTDQDPEYADAGWDINELAIVTHRLAVDPDCQGMGIARKLLAQAELVAEEKNIHILRVDTNSENKATQALFPKSGYTFSGEIGLAKRPGLRFFCYQKLL